MENNDQKIIFDMPDELSIVNVVYDILKNNGLKEGPKEWLQRIENNKESQFLIVRSATVVLFQKKIPEEKLIELLAKHLETSKETAQKIISEIKQKLIPYAKMVDLNKIGKEKETAEPDLSAQEIMLKKIGDKYPAQDTSKIPTEILKQVEVKDVDKNAEQLKIKRESMVQPNTIGQEIQKKEPDKYREPIE